MMKKYISGWMSLCLSVWLVSCNQPGKQAAAANTATPVSAADAPTMKFESNSYDFGTINEGEVVTHIFPFTNTGKTPLIVENAVASCGCTVPDWPRTPVAPGETSSIKAEFNSRGKAGPQQKAITIYANTQPRETVVVLSGIVNAKPQ